MICIGKMNGSEVAFMPEPEFGVTPIVWDVVVGKGLLRRKGETNFRTIGTIEEWFDTLIKYYSSEQIQTWLN